MLFAGRLTGKIDARMLVGIGVVLMGVSLYMMTGFAIDQPSRPVIMSGVVQGLGLGLIFVPLQSLAFETLAPRMRTTGPRCSTCRATSADRSAFRWSARSWCG